MQDLRRAGEVPLARHRREVSELAQFQTIPPRYGSDQFSLGPTRLRDSPYDIERDGNALGIETKIPR
jgi:hypothetical protein